MPHCYVALPPKLVLFRSVIAAYRHTEPAPGRFGSGVSNGPGEPRDQYQAAWPERRRHSVGLNGSERRQPCRWTERSLFVLQPEGRRLLIRVPEVDAHR